MQHLPTQCLQHIEAANRIVVDESAGSIKRILALANGDLCDLKNGEKRIYYQAPDITSLEYLVNRALGTPGAKPITIEQRTANDIEDALSDIAHELEHLDPNADPLDPEGPLRSLIGAAAKRRAEYKQRQAALEERIIDFLPTAIERLTELCSGVTVHRERNGKTRIYTLRPNRRAIEHISRRIQGMTVPIIDSISGSNATEPNLTREYTDEDIKKMTTTELFALFKAAEASEKQEKKAVEGLPLLGSLRPPEERGMQGVGRNEGEGWGEVGGASDSVCERSTTGDDNGIPGSGDSKKAVEPALKLPAYFTAACIQMAEFLPTAMGHMKTLAQGATTIIDTDDGDRLVIDHAPDARANQFLIDLFIGAPKGRFEIKPTAKIDTTKNEEPINRYAEQIVKLCTNNPAHANQEAHIRTILQQLIENE